MSLALAQVMSQLRARVLVKFSSVVFTHPETKQLGRDAERLYGQGYLIREKHPDTQGIMRWAYKRTEKGSVEIGALEHV